MRHRNAGKALSRNSSHRKAMLRNMVTSLLKHGQIETTHARAKAIQPLAEKMITLAKRSDLHARRQALSYLQEKAVAHRLFDELKDKYLDRQGGYVRVIKKGVRKGDGAPVSIVQLQSFDVIKKAESKKEKKKEVVKPVGKKAEPEAQKKEDKVKPDDNGNL